MDDELNLDLNLDMSAEESVENNAEAAIPAGSDGQLEETEGEDLLTKQLDMYRQDHNPDHLFDYLNSLHTSFLQAMAIADAKPAEPAPAEMPASEPAVAVEPAQDIAVLPAAQQIVVPAEISQTEMKIEEPSETAVDVVQ